MPKLFYGKGYELQLKVVLQDSLVISSSPPQPLECMQNHVQHNFWKTIINSLSFQLRLRHWKSTRRQKGDNAEETSFSRFFCIQKIARRTYCSCGAEQTSFNSIQLQSNQYRINDASHHFPLISSFCWLNTSARRQPPRRLSARLCISRELSISQVHGASFALFSSQAAATPHSRGKLSCVLNIMKNRLTKQ
jgi:hypothetical protein